MSIAKQQLDWYFLEEDKAVENREDAPGWQAIADEETGRRGQEIPGQSHVPQRLYELLFGIALIYGVAVYLIWQQAAQRMVILESEVAAVRSELSEQQRIAIADGSSRDVAGPESDILILPHQFETQYLRFEASARTAALVKLVAKLSDAKYQQLHREFGLPLVLPVGKLKIIVDPVANHGESGGNRLVLPSPMIAAEQYGITEVDALTSEIFGRFANYALNKMLQGRAIKSQWRSIPLALQFYLQRENGHIRDWQLHSKYLYRRHLAQTQSIYITQQMDNATQALSIDELADPLIEFILETYGYVCVPLLLDAFEEHASWETLIPAVFSLPVAHFEKEWHTYLEQHYPIKEPYSKSKISRYYDKETL